MRILIGPSFLVINDTDEVYPVEVFIKGEKLKKGTAYVKDDIVYIYRGKLKNAADPSIPGVYKTSSGYVFVEPTKNEMNMYSVDNIVELDSTSIMKRLVDNPEQFQQPEDIEIINNNSECYKPTITPEDDFLKVAIKKAINDKKININQYKARFKNDFDLNNKKSGLKKSTKMTVNNFKEWCEILGLNWTLTLSDSGDDSINPLKDEIQLNSDEF